jgi:nucleoside-diphosphate kinase
MENVIHASSDPADAEREIRLWFRSDELLREVFPSQPAAAMKQPRRGS